MTNRQRKNEALLTVITTDRTSGASKRQGFRNSEYIHIVKGLTRFWRIFPESRRTLIFGGF